MWSLMIQINDYGKSVSNKSTWVVWIYAPLLWRQIEIN